jgi:hypothetical protein
MGFALFAYLSCLFLGFIYASFLNKLASASSDAADEVGQYRIVFDRAVLRKHFSRILATYFLACAFGLMAGYFMRLQSEYLYSDQLNIISYLLSSPWDLVSRFDLGGWETLPAAKFWQQSFNPPTQATKHL